MSRRVTLSCSLGSVRAMIPTQGSVSLSLYGRCGALAGIQRVWAHADRPYFRANPAAQISSSRSRAPIRVRGFARIRDVEKGHAFLLVGVGPRDDSNAGLGVGFVVRQVRRVGRNYNGSGHTLIDDYFRATPAAQISSSRSQAPIRVRGLPGPEMGEKGHAFLLVWVGPRAASNAGLGVAFVVRQVRRVGRNTAGLGTR